MTPVDTRQECARCGHVGYDVSTRIVEREATPDNPTLYGAEPRCMDRVACDERVEGEP